jgi:hypothetical protein
MESPSCWHKQRKKPKTERAEESSETRGRSGKRGHKDMNLSDVFNVLASDEYMIAGRDMSPLRTKDDDNYVVVYAKDDYMEHGMHTMKRVYRVLPGGDLEEVPIRQMINDVKSALKSKVNVDDLLEQVLTTSGPHPVIRAHEILSKYPGVVDQITSRKGCLFLEIPNPSPGEPSEDIYLRF